MSSYPTEPLKEIPSTYVVQDRSNLEEMHRLEVQDMLSLTKLNVPFLQAFHANACS